MFRHEEILKEIKDLRNVFLDAKRPANEVIMDDVDFRDFLKISKRTAASLREKRIITYSKIGGKIYYKLSDVLELIEKNQVPAISKNLKIAL